MSYSATIAFANVLYALKVPRRDGRPLGGTEFANMRAAYRELPEDLKRRLEGMTVLHDFNKFWEMMRQRPGSWRPPLSPEQRRQKPPVSHPIFLSHPITGDKVLYANPGYAIRINELPEDESDRTLAFLFEHQLQPAVPLSASLDRGRSADVGRPLTLHNAQADYGPDEPRLIKRCPGNGRPHLRSGLPAPGARRERACLEQDRFKLDRHSRESGNPGLPHRRLPLDPRFRGGDGSVSI